MTKLFSTLPEDLIEARVKGVAPWTKCVREDFHVSVFEDMFPVTKGHLLFIPEYATLGVIEDCFSDALREGAMRVESGEWEGFNVGLNIGEVAGQTVPWPHVHLIPRYKGDTPDPIGGVRRVVKGQGNYKGKGYKQP